MPGDPIASVDAIAVGDEVNPYWNVFRWEQLGVSSLTNALGYPGGVPLIIRDEPSAAGIFVAYQAGTKGARGLVYQQSDNRGETWLGEVVIDADIDKYAAVVINPTTYDIHLIYFQIGDPTLGAAGTLWYRVLAWSGGVWAIGAEKTLVVGAASHGYANASLGVRSGYLMALFYDRALTGTVRNMYSAKSVGTWDLFTSVNLDIEVALPTINVEVRVDLTRDDVGDKWYITTEQGGTFTIWSPSELLRPPGEITPVNLATWYGATTPQFDTIYNPSTATVGIVQENAGKLEFRTFDPATSLVSAPTVIEASAAFWPSIMVDQGGRFIVAYTKTATGDTRHLMVVRSDDWTATHSIATDSAAEEWGGTHIAQTSEGLDGIVIAWCDTADNDADTDYRVFCGVLDQQVFRAVYDTVLATEFMGGQHRIADTMTLTELLHASEPKSIADVAALVEVVKPWQRVADAAAITEAFAVNYRVTEDITFTEVIRHRIPVTDAITVTDALSFVWQLRVADTVALADTIRLAAIIDDVIAVDDYLEPMGFVVADAIAAGDATIVGVRVLESGTTTEGLRVSQAILDGATATEIINMLYTVMESALATDSIVISPIIAQVVSATDVILQLSVHSDSAITATETITKGTAIRIGVRLHLHGGHARLKMEGGRR